MANCAERQLERQAVLGLLVSGIVHEIANPLSAILMNAELGLLYLEQDGELEKLAEVLRTIAEEAKRGGILGQGLLRFAQADDYAPQTYGDLNEIIAQAGKLLGSKLRRSGVELVLQKTEELPKLMINPTALAVVLASLIDLLMSAGAKRIEVAAAKDTDEIVLNLNVDGLTSATLASDRYTELVLNFARRVLQAHAGVLSADNAALALHFPLNMQTP